MNNRRLILALTIISVLAALPAGSTPPPAGPKTQVWMDVDTHVMAGMPDMSEMADGGIMGRLAGKMMSGAMGGHSTMGYPDAAHPMMTGKYFDIAMRNSLNPGKQALQQIPAGLGLGDSLLLLPPEVSKGSSREGQYEMQDVSLRVLYYWGCDANVRPGQPKEFSFQTVNGKPSMSGSPVQGRYVPDRDVHPDPSYVLWPNRQAKQRASGNASLMGQHRITGQGVPESLKFELTQNADFMPKIALTSTGKPTDSVTYEWQPVERARAYFITAMGTRTSDKTIVFWSSSEVPEAGMSLIDFLPAANIERWLKERVLLPATATRCQIPKGIFVDTSGQGSGVGLMSMIAYGPDTIISGPPRPANPKVAWTPEWSVRVRTKSTATALLGMDMSAASAHGQRDAQQPKDQKEESGAKKLLKGLFRKN